MYIFVTIISFIINTLTSMFDYIINWLPSIGSLPDFSKLLEALDFDIPNLLDLIPDNLFSFDLSDLIDFTLCNSV